MGVPKKLVNNHLQSQVGISTYLDKHLLGGWSRFHQPSWLSPQAANPLFARTFPVSNFCSIQNIHWIKHQNPICYQQLRPEEKGQDEWSQIFSCSQRTLLGHNSSVYLQCSSNTALRLQKNLTLTVLSRRQQVLVPTSLAQKIPPHPVPLWDEWRTPTWRTILVLARRRSTWDPRPRSYSSNASTPVRSAVRCYKWFPWDFRKLKEYNGRSGSRNHQQLVAWQLLVDRRGLVPKGVHGGHRIRGCCAEQSVVFSANGWHPWTLDVSCWHVGKMIPAQGTRCVSKLQKYMICSKYVHLHPYQVGSFL